MTTSIHDVALVGQSRAMQRLRALVETVAPTRLPALVEGETGTGKELIAALLHHRSGRTGSLVAFNVCALGESMFEDSLFGHARGAYTGAIGESLGFLREANGGTVFFDEISGLPMALQAKLLRAVETGVFRPIGAARDVRSDFRIVAATNERLAALVEQGRFRSDLRHRLSGVVISVPSLAERTDDIPDLTRHFARHARGNAFTVDDDAIDRLMSLAWPGNIRELRQVVEAASAFAHRSLDTHALTLALSHRSDQPLIQEPPLGADRSALIDVLDATEWDVERAAAQLGVHRATCYRRMKRHGIDVPRVAGRATRREQHSRR